MRFFGALFTQQKPTVFGSVHLTEKKLIFSPFFSKINRLEVEYSQITKMEKEFVPITKLLRFVLKDSSTFAISVFNRNKMINAINKRK